MRVSPVAWASGSLRGVLSAASESAVVTHNHPEGIKGAQAVAAAVFWARNGISKEEIRTGLIARFGYDLTRSAREISKDYAFDVSCQGSVPEALICFFDSENFEDAIRLAVMLGGDADPRRASPVLSRKPTMEDSRSRLLTKSANGFPASF